MKKILIVLMMVFGLSAVFAKPVVFKVNNAQILTDDDNELKYFGSSMTDEEIAMGMYEINFLDVYPSGVTIEEADWISEKFYKYMLLSDDLSYALNVINLGDGRQVVAFYDLKEHLE